MRYPYFSVGQSLGPKITQQQAMVRMHEQNQFANLPKPTNQPSYDNLTKKAEQVLQKEHHHPEEKTISLPHATQKPEKSYSKWNKASPLTKVAAVEQSLSSDFDFDDYDEKLSEKPKKKQGIAEPKKLSSFENMLRDFGVEAAPKKTDSKTNEIRRISPIQKPSPLSTFKDLLDDEELESLLGKESPSKSRLPHSRTKLNSREKEGSGLKTKGYSYQPTRFSPEKRHGALPGLAGSKPPRAEGLTRLQQHQQRFSRGHDLNKNNNANENDIFQFGALHNQTPTKENGRRSLRARNEAFWSNLLDEPSKKTLPDIGHNITQPFQPSKQKK